MDLTKINISKVKPIATLSLVVAAFKFHAFKVLAQVTPEEFIPDDPSGSEGGLIEWIQAGLNLAIGLSALVAVAVLVYGGILYITSSGDEGKIETATKAITYAIIGLVICFISVLIVNFVLEYVINGGGE